MISSPRYGLAALALALAATSLLYACDSDDDPGPVGQGATNPGGSGGTGASTQGGGGTGAGTQGGGGTGAGGQGGQGGALSSPQTCMDACEAMVACGSGGGGAGGGPTLEACVDPCYESLEACSSSELHEIMDCLTPHIDPNCDDAAFMTCVNAVGCAG